MNNLEIFEFEDKEIRTQVDANGNPLFCVKDICNGLFLTNSRQAATVLKENELVYIEMTSGGQLRKLTFTTESGLYKLIMQSKKQEAQNFKDWICEGVLPSLRKTGSYTITPQKLDSYQIEDPIERAQRWIEECKEKMLLLDESKKLNQNIEELKPKEEFYDNVINIQDSISIAKAAKVLNFESGFGQNKLFDFLRDQGILDKDNVPYQKYVNSKYFESIPITYKKGNKNCFDTKTLVTPKGLEFIIKKYKEHLSK